MADQQHLNKLKLGIEAWNKWRGEEYLVRPDLSEADLSGADLSEADLGGVYLARADLSGANLARAELTGTDLSGANLARANLARAELSGADLSGADLSGADLTGAELGEADLGGVYLSGVYLSGADLSGADLTGADLTEADLTGARVGWTIFGDVNLSMVKGLDAMNHIGPSTIGIDTISRSRGNIPEAFLRDAGVPDTFLPYMRSLIGQPLDFYSCFISYSTKDHAFAERLRADLQSKGVRCWFAPEDMEIGDVIRPRIDGAIRLYDKLLLVLSEHSVTSVWVKKEVETAFEKEQQQQRQILFPIRLDDTVMQTSQAWAADIRRMRHIGDFSNWKSHDDYQKALRRLLRDLKAEPQ